MPPPSFEIDLYIPDVAAQIKRDDFLIVNVSKGSFEPVVAAEPDLLIEPYNAKQRAAAQELGIPAMFYNSFWETPLGGAEHIKFWSLLFNKEAVANERFAPIAADYLALKAQVAQAVASDERPLVLHGQVTKDNTFSTFGPGRIDYHLTEDAGGRPVLVELGLVNADASFDSKAARRVCFNHSLIPNIPENRRNRKTPKPGRKRLFNQHIYVQRFVAERSFAWLDKFRTLLVRLNVKMFTFLAFILLPLPSSILDTS